MCRGRKGRCDRVGKPSPAPSQIVPRHPDSEADRFPPHVRSGREVTRWHTKPKRQSTPALSTATVPTGDRSRTPRKRAANSAATIGSVRFVRRWSLTNSAFLIGVRPRNHPKSTRATKVNRYPDHPDGRTSSIYAYEHCNEWPRARGDRREDEELRRRPAVFQKMMLTGPEMVIS